MKFLVVGNTWVDRLIARVTHLREPDFVIGGLEDPYLRRWWIIPRNPFFNIYLHQILRSDDDRALHDHMYVNMSIILRGRYREHTIAAGGVHRRVWRQAGSLVFRLPWTAHRLEIVEGQPCWTLFITGPRIREWGFHCPNGWRHHTYFTDPRDPGKMGRGCD